MIRVTGKKTSVANGGAGTVITGSSSEPYGDAVAIDQPFLWYRERVAADFVTPNLKDYLNRQNYNIDTASGNGGVLVNSGPTGGKYFQFTAVVEPPKVAYAGFDGVSLLTNGYAYEFWILLGSTFSSAAIASFGAIGAPDELLHIPIDWDSGGLSLVIGHNWFADDLSTGPISGVAIGWHHIVCTWNKALNRREIYLDGVLVGFNTPSGTPNWSSDIGLMSDASVNVAEQALYTRYLNPSRIVAHFAAGS
jgi:hypothetical protein